MAGKSRRVQGESLQRVEVVLLFLQALDPRASRKPGRIFVPGSWLHRTQRNSVVALAEAAPMVLLFWQRLDRQASRKPDRIFVPDSWLHHKLRNSVVASVVVVPVVLPPRPVSCQGEPAPRVNQLAS